jgi:t-SNARE complex subunit (syntaxin)
MVQQVRIENSALIRDIHSKAILNTDKNGLNEYLIKREAAKKQQAEHSETKQRLAKLEEDMSEIKSLLRDIAEMRKV